MTPEERFEQYEKWLAQHNEALAKHEQWLAKHDEALGKHDETLAKMDELFGEVGQIQRQQAAVMLELAQRADAVTVAVERLLEKDGE